jgi:hypothetical protein
MGVCTTSSFFCGFMIYNPADLRSLASALDKFWKKEFNETPIQEAPVTEVPIEVSELSESIDSWLRQSGRPFMAHSNFEENDSDIEPAVVLCYSKGGNELTKWGHENCTYFQYPKLQLSLTETWADGSKYEVIWKLWADEEFLREAKEAFDQLGEDPVMKEAKIVPEMEWIQGLSVG